MRRGSQSGSLGALFSCLIFSDRNLMLLLFSTFDLRPIDLTLFYVESVDDWWRSKNQKAPDYEYQVPVDCYQCS